MSHSADIAAGQTGRRWRLISWAAYCFSMFASLVLHGAFLVLLLLFFSGGGGGSGGSGVAGSGGGDFIEVGMSTAKGGGSDSKSNGKAEVSPSIDQDSAPSLPTFRTELPPLDDVEPPVALLTPNVDSPFAAAVNAPPTSVNAVPDLSRVPRSSGAFRPSTGSGGGVGSGVGTGRGDGTGTGGGGGAGHGTGRGTGDGPGIGSGTTRFFNLRDNGLKFVYVLDRSVSMSSYDAIRVAKAQLLLSLESLTPEQQFQIVFYNEQPTVLQFRNNDGASLLRATDINRTQAAQFVAGIRPESSTEHFAALKRALAFQPDVIFLLTDAGEPQLSRADMEKIRKLNSGRTRIHCVEFHQGRRLTKEVSFLERLAKENGGNYEFRDITEFARARLENPTGPLRK
jgi:hypothetical protein